MLTDSGGLVVVFYEKLVIIIMGQSYYLYIDLRPSKRFKQNLLCCFACECTWHV